MERREGAKQVSRMRHRSRLWLRRCCPLIGFLVFGIFTICTTRAEATTTHRYRRNQQGPLLCQLGLNLILNQDNTHDEFFSCSLFIDNDTLAEGTFAIKPPPNIFNERRRELLRRGQELYLEILGGEVTEDEILIPDDATLRVVHPHSLGMRHRSLGRRPDSTGSFMAVMIRIITTDAEPVHSKDELFDYLFKENDLSAKTQFEKCSGGALTMNADPDLGVINVRLDTTAKGKSNKALMNLAEVKVNQQYNGLLGGNSIRNHADTLMFVLPKGTGNWAAFATVAGKSVRAGCQNDV